MQNIEALHIATRSAREGLLQIYSVWLELLSDIEQPNLFQHPAWYLAHFNALGDNNPAIDFVCVYRGRNLVAVYPLSYKRRGPFHYAVLPFAATIFHADCAVVDDEDKHELWSFVRSKAKSGEIRKWDVFQVRNDGALETSHMVQSLKKNTLTTEFTEKPDGCNVVEVGNYEQAFAALPKNFRANLTRRKKRISRELNAEFVCFTSPDHIPKAYESFVKLELSGWKGNTSQTKKNYFAPQAIGLFEWKTRFFRDLLVELGKQGAVELRFMQTQGKNISALICIVLGDTSCVIKTTYDERYARFSPGVLGMDELNRSYANAGMVRNINLVSDYDWQKKWNPKRLKYFEITEFNSTIRGWILWAVYFFRRTFRLRSRQGS